MVDDNPDAAATLTLLLESSGQQVRIAHDSLQALEVARHVAPQIGILDIGLPLLDGNAGPGVRARGATRQPGGRWR